MQLINEKKARIMSDKSSLSVEKKDFQGRDIFSLLVKSNMASDIPENQRLTDEDVLARTSPLTSVLAFVHGFHPFIEVPTFLAAGHETTATATGWVLCELAKNPELQQKLREELLAVESETPTMEELNQLPYLDKVVRETLRLHSPVTMVSREAQYDDVIPVSEPFLDASGKLQHGIGVKQGNRVFIGIVALQTSKEIWGEDALEFKYVRGPFLRRLRARFTLYASHRPDRWDNPPEAIASTPGVWGHLLTFLGGTRACIGYRFSLAEYVPFSTFSAARKCQCPDASDLARLKALIFTLIRAFELELAAPAEDIQAIGSFIQRVGLRGQEVAALPLVLLPYRR